MKIAALVFGVMSLSLSVFASQGVSVGKLADLGLLKEGTRVGQCEIVKFNILRAYGTGPISGAQVVVFDGRKEVMGLLNESLDISNQGNVSVLTSSIDSTTGGDSPLSGLLERKTSLSVSMEIQQVSSSQSKVTKLVVEKKKANFFGSMKTIDSQSIYCAE